MKINAVLSRFKAVLLVLPILSSTAVADGCFKPASFTDIMAEANKLCTLEDKKGSTEYYQISGNGKGNVSLGVIGKKLFGASLEASGKKGKTEYYNVLQKDLIRAIEQRGKCDDILKIIVDYQKMLLDSSKSCSQAAAEREERSRKQSAASKQKKSEIYRTFTTNFKDQTALVFGSGSLVETIQALAEKESVLTEIEFAFPPDTYDKAASLFEIARQCIACAWNEANKPAACDADRGANSNHPVDQYKEVYTSLKKQMSADIRSN